MSTDVSTLEERIRSKAIRDYKYKLNQALEPYLNHCRNTAGENAWSLFEKFTDTIMDRVSKSVGDSAIESFVAKVDQVQEMLDQLPQ